ncbi:hypothetical protein IEQ34_014278 [Dendrobium chrysotoxum]|uniref:Uncharacterized protein n=1 Tax=Dendrobium chrysotoxum TaxID=161865 RepID=A0AAV7GIT1_DENCH|nr:hypothetical protein IEQ34_014278 [Dendrobium chrysotoxum]
METSLEDIKFSEEMEDVTQNLHEYILQPTSGDKSRYDSICMSYAQGVYNYEKEAYDMYCNYAYNADFPVILALPNSNLILLLGSPRIRAISSAVSGNFISLMTKHCFQISHIDNNMWTNGTF